MCHTFKQMLLLILVILEVLCLTLSGEVIGVNAQIYSRTGGFMGVSFAIPSDTVNDVYYQLKTKGKVSRGWLGVYIQEIDDKLAKSFGLKKSRGRL